MAIGTVLISLFAFLGVVALSGLLLYYLSQWIKTWKKPAAANRWPSDNYMKEIGSHCPDYWTYQGQKMVNGKLMDICANTYNVDVPEDTCYDDAKNKQKSFRAIKWNKFRKSSYGNSDRCNWIRQCGPPVTKIPGQSGSNSYASWTGIAENC